MPEVIIPGPEGRLEGNYSPADTDDAPLALILHAHPQGGGSMNTRVITGLYDIFKRRGYATLRFNLRGVGRSVGEYDHGQGELQDAATVLDWMQALNPNASLCWIAGHSFGAWIGMQLLMRRPEIRGFISVSPPMNMYDFGFLAPCPTSGLLAYGSADRICPPDEIERVSEKIRIQKGTMLTHKIIPGAGHLFEDHAEELETEVEAYLDYRQNGMVDPSLEEFMQTKKGRR